MLKIEAGKDHWEWQEELYNVWDQREGAKHRCWQERVEGDSEDEHDELERAHCRLMTDGQKLIKFHNRVNTSV